MLEYYTTDNTSDDYNSENQSSTRNISQEEYEKNLKKIQEEHLEIIKKFNNPIDSIPDSVPRKPWKPCFHDGCDQCHGTFIKLDGSACVHMLHCDCPKCSPWCC